MLDEVTDKGLDERSSAERSETLAPLEGTRVGRILAVMSGKGGVGKSSVAAILAGALVREGARVGVLDADITGPSMPRLLGVQAPPELGQLGPIPPLSPGGIKVMSLNSLLAHEDDPVIWRGPLISGAVRQFWTEVEWGQLDYLVVDLPPGTGDAPLTVLRQLPVDGLVVVSCPQDLALMVVGKAVKMARSMGVSILGLIENMSVSACPHCGEKLEIFGPSQGASAARAMDIPLLGVLPLDPEISRLGDLGRLDQYQLDFLERVLQGIQSLCQSGKGKGWVPS